VAEEVQVDGTIDDGEMELRNQVVVELFPHPGHIQICVLHSFFLI
jgi:hypothetical protein